MRVRPGSPCFGVPKNCLKFALTALKGIADRFRR